MTEKIPQVMSETTDWKKGPPNAPVTLVEYGDFECPQCRAASGTVKALLARFGAGELKFVFRHFPMTQIHPRAERAAEAAEAAGEQGFFWEMHDLLFERQENLSDAALVEYAAESGLDIERFLRAMSERRWLGKVRENRRRGLAARVCGTPTFFINEQIYEAARDIELLHRAILTVAEK